MWFETMRSIRLIYLVALAVLLLGCTGYKEQTAKTNETVKISEIKNHINEYKGKLVKISGIYLGWRGNGTPPVTRSDWAIKDESGQIYVTGKFPNLDPYRDVGKNITVVGYVELTKDGRVYIRAVNIIY